MDQGPGQWEGRLSPALVRFLHLGLASVPGLLGSQGMEDTLLFGFPAAKMRFSQNPQIISKAVSCSGILENPESLIAS